MTHVYLVDYIVRCLVTQPDQIRIDEVRNETTSILELRVHESDLGRIIGKHGRIAKSLRNLIAASSNTERRSFHLEIID